ncbi:MAG: hypothetical protein NWF00_09955 [Candidatus Bathyarchaeota archaeon]|nr:hypothetical protein [Candidatus Bathyarchaeota archaeon]
MSNDFCRILVENFLRDSWISIKTLVEKVQEFNPEKRRSVSFFKFKNNQRVNEAFDGNHFFLRGSVEYTNPHLTVEEAQGIIGTRLLEVCGNYYYENGLREPEAADVGQLCELLKKPKEGKIVGFLLNTDDVEPDRYSMNPLKTSIVESGQSAFPVANVNTQELKIDEQFATKYAGTLICPVEIELIRELLGASDGSYLDFVDSVKYAQLVHYTDFFGMDLFLPSLRLPLTTLQNENKDGLLHHIISETHKDYESVEQAYECMGRSISKRTTLLTVPHSSNGYGSKRAARGKIYFDDSKFERVTVKYKDTLLYPNDVDPKDVSVAKCQDSFTVNAEKLSNYVYSETPSSPQFFLYSMGSPEDAALWHGVGAFGAPKLLESYNSIRSACRKGKLLKGLQKKYDARVDVPLHLNLVPSGMWVHPVHRNIDASIGCVKDLGDLARMGMKIEYLANIG